MRRTKILATLGPASSDEAVLDAMIASGLDAVRLNFSHGTPETHAAHYLRVREAAARARRPIAILQELQGPKIRIGKVQGEGIDLVAGEPFVITTNPMIGVPGMVSTEYADLARDVGPTE